MIETSHGAQETIAPVRNRINWITIVALIIFHIGAVAALFMFTWKVFFTTLFLYWFSIGLGISMGYHRLHTHRSYKCPVWMEYLFAICGTLNLEGGPIFWVATHRVHHQKSDQPGDPHSPNDGAFWSQMQDGVDIWKDIANGVIKSMVFGIAVTFIALLEGYQAQATPEGVARATTRTVVIASLTVLWLDFLMTALMFNT